MGGASCTKQTMHERGTSSLHASAPRGLCTITFDGKLVVTTTTTGKWNCDPFVPMSRRTHPRLLQLLR
jgi:hypothetical protein